MQTSEFERVVHQIYILPLKIRYPYLSTIGTLRLQLFILSFPSMSFNWAVRSPMQVRGNARSISRSEYINIPHTEKGMNTKFVCCVEAERIVKFVWHLFPLSLLNYLPFSQKGLSYGHEKCLGPLFIKVSENMCVAPL